ncbi:MAG: hypothetical protein AVDCRST_MAG02-2616 [uncultured Rubrobacteraceae bacterium]|uniref:Uncharacterized protein n=1 Tax=uncultured Rubrobacteraceae bacterium TaxID=349277 RepID=A0A6J4R2Z3_9ACTN|nr:MAG: hypothetical protein AVDCRST_MAG02-2616 [uncultured Rubrobacteraceae bacterium]
MVPGALSLATATLPAERRIQPRRRRERVGDPARFPPGRFSGEAYPGKAQAGG